MPWLWVPNCLLFPHGFQLFCDWLKLGGIIACNLGNFSFSFIFYSIRRIKLRAWANFEVCWWFFFHFYIFIIRSKFEFLWFLPVCDWLQNWAELSRVNRAIVRFHHEFFRVFFLFLEYLRQ
jgi:hypothetical protein